MAAPGERILYRVVDDFPYLGREEEHANRTAEEAAVIFEDLTGEKVDEVLAELDEPCNVCTKGVTAQGWMCMACHGTGRRHDPVEWEDDETGRTVTLRPEVSP